MKKIDWCHSKDGENFTDSFATREEAIADAEASYCDGYTSKFYIGQAVGFKPHIYVDNLLERMNEEACEQCGEYAEDYLYYVSDKDKKELSDKLNEVFQAWAKKTSNEPTFFTVKNIEMIEVE